MSVCARRNHPLWISYSQMRSRPFKSTVFAFTRFLWFDWACYYQARLRGLYFQKHVGLDYDADPHMHTAVLKWRFDLLVSDYCRYFQPTESGEWLTLSLFLVWVSERSANVYKMYQDMHTVIRYTRKNKSRMYTAAYSQRLEAFIWAHIYRI